MPHGRTARRGRFLPPSIDEPVLNPSDFYNLVSGRRRGFSAALARLALRAVEGPYAMVVRLRNRRYDTSTTAVHRVDVPVVSVGNLTLGGTGKTPLVEWIVRWFHARGIRVAVVSRGYGAKQGARNDEALELAQKLPGVPHVQDPDRVAAAGRAIEKFGAEAIVLDDAFQHRRLHRDLDVVLLDALEPFGFSHVFPRGTLREPLAGLRRAQLVGLSRADMLEPDERKAVWQTVRRHAPEAACFETVHAPRALLAADGSQQPIEGLRGRRVAAFCGIGNPAGFRHTLEACGYDVVGFREYPDHHRYTSDDVESLAGWADQLDASGVVCTHKDLVKLDVSRLGTKSLMAVSVGLKILEGEAELVDRLKTLLA